MVDKTNSNNENQFSTFEKEIARLPDNIKNILLKKAKVFSKLADKILEKTNGKEMGFFINPLIEIKENIPVPDYNKLTFNFLLDDFEKPISFFDPKLLLEKDFDKFLIEEKKKDEYGQEYLSYYLKEDKNIEFYGTSISIMRENCFDSSYEDLKRLGTSFVYLDTRGFISALKTIDIHRNMLLQKFEKYVVVYAGAGSWLRGEKSNDFDVFIVIDDTDVKRMPRFQVKDQLTKIIWQMSREVANLTGIQIHIQVYLLTDFWDALKDAHPVMFTFLRDGVPFYDRGLYSAWKELLKLGKIRPSPEAIDLHMNAGTQLIDRAKKVFADVAMNDIYYAYLNPAQAILMLKGFNPTTPKETVRIFKEVLFEKEKLVTKEDTDGLESAVKLFKSLEHEKDARVSGQELDKMINGAEKYLKNIKKIFENISEEKTKESIITSYAELENQIKNLPGMIDVKEIDLIKTFEKNFVNNGKMPSFVKSALKEIVKAKNDYEKGKITITEVNKVLKDLRNIQSEIKDYRDKIIINEVNSKKLTLRYDENKLIELLSYGGKIYLFDLSNQNSYEYKENKFIKSSIIREDMNDSKKFGELELNSQLLDLIKKTLKIDKLLL